MITLVLKRANLKSMFVCLKFESLEAAKNYAEGRVERLIDILDKNNNSILF
jgi:hypothetical protein